MSLLFETIKCQNRQLHNLKYHDLRVRKSLENLFGFNNDFDFASTIEIPDWVGEGAYRCRVSYSETIENVVFFSYIPKHPTAIQLIENEQIKYEYKYEDRKVFQELIQNSVPADEVIITQNQLLTDATFANIALFDGTKWFTPAGYLLRGTKRQQMLDNEQLTEAEIRVSELSKFKKIALINAMRDLDLAYNFSLQSSVIVIG